MNIPSILDKSLETQWEVFVQHSRRTEIQLRHSRTEAKIGLENTGYGVRVIIPRSDGAGIGFASCNSEKELEGTARKAHDLARVNRSPLFELPGRAPLPSVETVDKKILRDEEGVTEDYAEEVQTLISDEKDISLTYGKIRMYVVENQILNSRGLTARSVGTYCYLEMTFKIGETNPTEYWPTRFARRIDDIEPSDIITEWLSVARSSLKRRPPKTKETTVILSPNVVCDIFVPTIGYHASAEAVKANLSHFKRGVAVASKELTIFDDGLYPYGLRTNSFDDEGQPQRRTRLIEKGTFRDYIYDQLHAQTMDAKPTGNGIRSKAFGVDVDERYQLPPSDETTNLSIKPGQDSLDEMIEDVKDGLIIYQGAWINPDRVTTSFGSEIRNAREIRNGELGDGIVGGTLSGSALELMKKVTALSNGAQVISGSSFACVAPFIRVDGVQISGPS